MADYSDKKIGNLFPTRTGDGVGGSKERKMLDSVEGGNSFRTKLWLQPDGSTTRLKTKSGMPEFITEKVDEEFLPCKDFSVLQDEDDLALKHIKAMLLSNPNPLYGKQIGDSLFIDHDAKTEIVDIPTGAKGRKNFSLPAREGDCHLVRFPWSTKDLLLFGRDRHYCPYPKSSVKAGYLRWPYGVMFSGQKKVFVLELKITWSCGTHYLYSPSYTQIDVFDAEHPDVVLKTLMFDGVYGQKVTLNSTPDSVHAVLTMTGIWPTLNNWNSDDHPNDPIDPQGQLIVEFEATYDGALHVDSAVLFDAGSAGSVATSAYATSFAVPNAYMAPYVPTMVSPAMDNTGTYYPILAGYGYHGERKFIYLTQEYVWSSGAFNTTVRVWVNDVVVCSIDYEQYGATLSTVPAGIAASSADYIFPPVPFFDPQRVHAVAVTNNCVVFGAWREAEKHFGNPVPYYGAGNFYCAASIEGDVSDIGRQELRIFPGNPRMFWYVGAYSDWLQLLNATKKEEYKADPIRAGISWNPISKEFHVENAIDPDYYDPANLEYIKVGGVFMYVPATAVVGTGFVGTRKKL